MKIINQLYTLLVEILTGLSNLTGLSYETILVLLIFVIFPVIIILLTIRVYNLSKDVTRYKLLYEKFVSNDIKNLI